MVMPKFADRLWLLLLVPVAGVLLAKWSWVLFTPVSVSVPLPANLEVSPHTEQLFGQAAVSTKVAQAAPTVPMPEMRLIGVFAHSRKKDAFAIMVVEGNRQVGVGVGDEIASGAKLVSVHADHVMVEFAGAQQRVELGKQAGPVVAAGPTEGSTHANDEPVEVESVPPQ